MSTLCCSYCCLHSARATAYNKHISLTFCRSDKITVSFFSCCHRIYCTLEIISFMQSCQTIQTSQAGNDILRMSVTCLLWEIRICDQGTCHCDHICLAVCKDFLCQLRCIDSAKGNDRCLNACCLHFCCIMYIAAVRKEHGWMGMYCLFLFYIKTCGNMNKINLSIDQLCKFDCFIDLKTAFNLLRTGHTVFDQEVLSAALSDRIDYHDRKSCSVLDGAAEFICSCVIERRKELIQKPAVTTMKQNHIIACILQDLCTICKMLYNLIDLILGHAVNLHAIPTFCINRTPGHPVIIAMVCFLRCGISAMIQLVRSKSASFVNCTDNLCQHRLVFSVNGKGTRISRAMLMINRCISENDNGRTASCFLTIISNHGIIRSSLKIHMAHHVRCRKNSVFKGCSFYGKRFK